MCENSSDISWHGLNLNQSKTNCPKNLNSDGLIVREMGHWPECIFRSLLQFLVQLMLLLWGIGLGPVGRNNLMRVVYSREWWNHRYTRRRATLVKLWWNIPSIKSRTTPAWQLDHRNPALFIKRHHENNNNDNINDNNNDNSNNNYDYDNILNDSNIMIGS